MTNRLMGDGMTKLQLLIKKRNIKQRELAKQLGISNSALSLIVNGKSVPTLKVALKIARAVNMTVEDLWGDLIE
ncbi:helix-turn-helix transcriptional regulator [Robertmurraya sp. DFI.2.37]|uniref:helix-turn-helix transcriptional regulator n=1 Tax=Robertmurraya sp. DFI.2.37 TaxID=3031819 RepID=UPI0027953C2A|nr:helix-turn-helix transcriptional regulator [Robertmurraya sp. DFI.2.37]